QRNLYKAFVEAYESDKIILDTYRETVTLKRRREDDADKEDEPSVGLDWGSKRRRKGKEPEGASSRKYTSSITKTKAVDYGHIKWIEDLVPRTMWIEEPICYDKHALWGVSHWGRKRQQFYGFAVNRESARDVYSKRIIIDVIEIKIVEWYNYKYLDWITEDHEELREVCWREAVRGRLQDATKDDKIYRMLILSFK
nr:hypothetical protein [Tanacetum cinerariifolium]